MTIDPTSLGGPALAHLTARSGHAGAPQTAFDALLEGRFEAPLSVEDIQQSSSVRFSRHATARLRSRDVTLTRSDLHQLEDAVDRLDEKGARESLVLQGETAFIIGVPRRTVITALPRHEATGSIFTNIDSTLVVR